MEGEVSGKDERSCIQPTETYSLRAGVFHTLKSEVSEGRRTGAGRRSSSFGVSSRENVQPGSRRVADVSF